MSTQSSSKKLDTSSKKKSFSNTSGKKKFTKKSQTHKRKPAAISVAKKSDGLYELQDGPTTSHSFVNEQVILSHKTESPTVATPSCSTAERKRALVEMKRLEKEQLEEEKLLKEKENLQLQELLEKQRLEKSQHELDVNDDDDDADSTDGFLKLSKIKCPYVTPGQVSGLAELERLQILQPGLELSAVEEGLNEQSAQRDKEVEELLQRARDAEAAFSAKLREQERLQRLKEVSQ